AAHLKAAGVTEIVVANRSPERAEAIAAEVGGRARALSDLAALLEEVDIVLTSTAASTFLLGVPEAKRILKARRYRPLFLIDLAVPRDIDPRVGELDNVFLYDVDDLQQVAEGNKAERAREAEGAEEIVAAESTAFVAWLRSLEVVPTLVALREKCVAIARQEAERTLQHMGELPEPQRKAVERLAESIVNKILHTPLTELKREGANG